MGDGNSPADRIKLLNVAFGAFTAIGRAFGPSLKEDVRAVAVALYAGNISFCTHACTHRSSRLLF